jgi:hypothetical protein
MCWALLANRKAVGAADRRLETSRHTPALHALHDMPSKSRRPHMTAKEFREYAEEHFGWAKTARSARERQTFLQMAQAWLEAADVWEAVYGVEPTSCERRSADSH